MGSMRRTSPVARRLAAASGVEPRQIERWSADGMLPHDAAATVPLPVDGTPDPLDPASVPPHVVQHLRELATLTGRGKDNDRAAISLLARGHVCPRQREEVRRMVARVGGAGITVPADVLARYGVPDDDSSEADAHATAVENLATQVEVELGPSGDPGSGSGRVIRETAAQWLQNTAYMAASDDETPETMKHARVNDAVSAIVGPGAEGPEQLYPIPPRLRTVAGGPARDDFMKGGARGEFFAIPEALGELKRILDDPPLDVLAATAVRWRPIVKLFLILTFGRVAAEDVDSFAVGLALYAAAITSRPPLLAMLLAAADDPRSREEVAKITALLSGPDAGSDAGRLPPGTAVPAIAPQKTPDALSEDRKPATGTRVEG